MFVDIRNNNCEKIIFFYLFEKKLNNIRINVIII